MARLRAPEKKPLGVDVVLPAELADHDSPAWHDESLFRAWSLEHVGSLLKPFQPGPYWRYMAGLEGWAELHHLMTGGLMPKVDYERLAPLGVSRIKSLERARMSGWTKQ